MDHFRMKEQRIELSIGIGHRGDGRICARGNNFEALWRRLDEVAVACPDAQLFGDVGEERRGIRRQDGRTTARAFCGRGLDSYSCMAELALRCWRNASAKHVGHELHAVADAQDRAAKIEQLWIAPGCARFGDALRPAREDDSRRLTCPNLLGGRLRRDNFRINRQLSKPPRDKLCVLRPEIQDEDGLMTHGNRPSPGSYGAWERSTAIITV